MSDLDVIAKLLIQLNAFYQTDNWPQFMQTDTQLRSVLQLLDREELSEERRQALVKLKAVYRQIYQSCQNQLKRIEEKMVKHVHHQEGAIAYATYNEITWSK